MKRLRMLVMAATVLGTMAIAPHAGAHWENGAVAYGYDTGSTADVFYLNARNDDRVSYALIQVDPFTGARPIGTYVVTQLDGRWLSDMDYAVGPNVESTSYGNMVGAQYRFRSGNEAYCTRWDFDPWNGYVQHWSGGTSERCPETFANVPGTGTRPPSNLIIR